jgi:hypothetical protein
MKPREAKTLFLKRLKAAGQSLETLTAAAGVTAMLTYFADERADGCDPDQDGDMLLFQWGTNDWGDGPAFEVNITRQLIVTDDEDEEPRQLSLTFRFDRAVTPQGLKDGSKWCEAPDQLASYRRFLAGAKALRAVGQESPASVELRYGRT